MAIIYKITNTVNSKIYIGYTNQTLKSRWAEHCEASRNLANRRGNSRFMRAIRKYGVAAFVREILIEDEDAEKCLNYWEPFFIAKFNSTDRAIGYNSTSGGGVMFTYTPEVLAKISAAVKAKWADPEVKARRSAAIKARCADPEVKARRSAASKARWADPEVKAKMGAAVKANWADPE